MRDGILKDCYSCDIVTIAAAWPFSAQIAPLPIPDIEQPARNSPSIGTATASKVPPLVGGLIAAAYAVVLAVFAFSSVVLRGAVFMIVVAVSFIAMALQGSDLLVLQRWFRSQPSQRLS